MILGEIRVNLLKLASYQKWNLEKIFKDVQCRMEYDHGIAITSLTWSKYCSLLSKFSCVQKTSSWLNSSANLSGDILISLDRLNISFFNGLLWWEDFAVYCWIKWEVSQTFSFVIFNVFFVFCLFLFSI